MSDERTEYWRDAFLEALEATGKLELFTSNWTGEEITRIASDLASSAECVDMAFPQPDAPLLNELKRLEMALSEERSKVICRVCNGSGSVTTKVGPLYTATSDCHKCHGVGRVLP